MLILLLRVLHIICRYSREKGWLATSRAQPVFFFVKRMTVGEKSEDLQVKRGSGKKFRARISQSLSSDSDPPSRPDDGTICRPTLPPYFICLLVGNVFHVTAYSFLSFSGLSCFLQRRINIMFFMISWRVSFEIAIDSIDDHIVASQQT